MRFCVSFITVAGDIDSDLDEVWVSGNIMSGLLNHNNKTVKYVFDKTVIMKPGGVLDS